LDKVKVGLLVLSDMGLPSKAHWVFGVMCPGVTHNPDHCRLAVRHRGCFHNESSGPPSLATSI